MKVWKQELNRLPTDEAKRKEASSTEIVFQFMKEEIYTCLKAAKDRFSKPELNIEIFPASTADISNKQPIVYISVHKQSGGNSQKYSLTFKQEKGLNQEKWFVVEAILIGRHGVSSLSIDLEGGSPTTLVEEYINQLGEQLQ